MPCDARAIAPELKRFATLHGWRDMEKSDRITFAEEFARIPQSPFHARAIIDHWLTVGKFVPSMAELREVAEMVPRHPAPIGSGGCDACEHTGRTSAWYLFTAERSPSGRVMGWRREIVPPDPGDEKFYLSHPPKIQGLVDDLDQRVVMGSAFCSCALGERLKAAAFARRHEDGTQ